MRHWVLFFEPTKKTFGLLDARFAPIEKILLAFDAHGFLSSGCLCEELSTVSATKVGHRRTCAVRFLPAGRRCETSEREDGMSLGVLQEYRDQSGRAARGSVLSTCQGAGGGEECSVAGDGSAAHLGRSARGIRVNGVNGVYRIFSSGLEG